jgi:predicted alpha/beta-hydrolase family hydrolase
MPAAPSGQPSILFAPGAGASSSSSWMTEWAERLSSVGPVTRFDYPYMLAGRRRPDPQPALIAAHREALVSLRERFPGPVVLAGKSMGSRMGCHVSLEEPVACLVCFGYPLRAAGSGKLRDAVLCELSTPILFVQGTRDALCPLDDLEKVRARMQAPNELLVVEGGDHSLEITARSLKEQGVTRAEVDARLLSAIERFVKARLATTS